MKKMFILAAGVLLSASAVQAQSGNSSDATLAATLSGLFWPTQGSLMTETSTVLITAPAAPFALASVPARNAPQPLNQDASARWFSTAQVSTMNRSIATLTSSTTNGNAAQAVNELVGVIKTLSVEQQKAFLMTSAGRSIISLLSRAMMALAGGNQP